MEKQFFPAIATNNTGGKSTFQALQSYIDRQLETILKSPIYRGRTGNNLEITDIEHFNSVQLKNIQITDPSVQCYTKSLLYKKSYIEDFLTETGFFSAATIKEFWSGNEFNLGIKNCALYLTTDLDENDIRVASVADPILLYDNERSISYILYIIEREDKPYPVCEYHLANIGSTVDSDGKTWTRIAVQKCQGKEMQKVSTQVYAADMKGPKGDAASGADYKLGTGISFFKNIYPTKDEKVPYHIWDEIHRPVVYERYASSDGDEIVKADEPSQRARYILDLKMLDFGKNPNQEAGYKICQWEDFVTDLLRCNIKLTDSDKIDIPSPGTPSYTRLFPTERVITYSDTSAASDIMDEMYKILKDLDMSLWGKQSEDLLEPDHIGPSQYKCILYNDVLLYDEDPVLDRCSFFNYNNGIFKTAWHAYHRLMEFDGLGDNDSYRFNKEDKYASYSVALNACWDIVDSIYEGRGGVVKTTCYDIMEDGADPFAKSEGDDEYGIPYPIKDRFDPVKFHMQGGKNNSYLCVEFVKVKINTGEFEVESRKDISLKTSGEINLLSRCIRPDGLNKVIGYGTGEEGGIGHNEHIFTMTPEMLFTWMHGEGDIVMTHNSYPKWLDCIGKDVNGDLKECWEEVNVPCTSAISFSDSSLSGFQLSDFERMRYYITDCIPPIYFSSLCQKDGSKSSHHIEYKNMGNDNNGGVNMAVYDHDLAKGIFGGDPSANTSSWTITDPVGQGWWEDIRSGGKGNKPITLEKWWQNSFSTKTYPKGFQHAVDRDPVFAGVNRIGGLKSDNAECGWVDSRGYVMSYYDANKISAFRGSQTSSSNDIMFEFSTPLKIEGGKIKCSKITITKTGSGEEAEETETVTDATLTVAELNALTINGNGLIKADVTEGTDINLTKLKIENIIFWNDNKPYRNRLVKNDDGQRINYFSDPVTLTDGEYLLLKFTAKRAYNDSFNNLSAGTKAAVISGSMSYYPASVYNFFNNCLNNYIVHGYKRTEISPLFVCDDDNRLFKIFINLAPQRISLMYEPTIDISQGDKGLPTEIGPIFPDATDGDISVKAIPASGSEWSESDTKYTWTCDDPGYSSWSNDDIRCAKFVAEPGENCDNSQNLIFTLKVEKTINSLVWTKTQTYNVILTPSMTIWAGVKAFIKGNYNDNPERRNILLSDGYSAAKIASYQLWTNFLLACKNSADYKGAHCKEKWGAEPALSKSSDEWKLAKQMFEDGKLIDSDFTNRKWTYTYVILQACAKYIPGTIAKEYSQEVPYDYNNGTANVLEAVYYMAYRLVNFTTFG